MLRWWEGSGGVGHVNVMFMLRWCYVDGRGGVGRRGGIDNRVLLWSSFVDVYLTKLCIWNHTYIYICIYTHTYIYIENNAALYIFIYVSVFLMHHRNLLALHHVKKNIFAHCLDSLEKIRELSMSSLHPASKVWDEALWKLWKRTCCSRVMKLKQQRAKKGWLSTCAVSC